MINRSWNVSNPIYLYVFENIKLNCGFKIKTLKIEIKPHDFAILKGDDFIFKFVVSEYLSER